MKRIINVLEKNNYEVEIINENEGFRSIEFSNENLNCILEEYYKDNFILIYFDSNIVIKKENLKNLKEAENFIVNNF